MNKVGIALMAEHLPKLARLKAVAHVDAGLSMRTEKVVRHETLHSLAGMISKALVSERPDLYRLTRVDDPTLINGDRHELDCVVMSPEQAAEFAAACFQSGLDGRDLA